ncbi:1,4-dihydroxy-2-naphthoate polyprenyltransferase [Phocaeicola paurosaccharolyticus]|uniref:1,4-dihydroxy-2-naphthoate polyprenyltransferase n=1 Tax=Phocaeicola paurosaccharolyticus TaxID=732242 RepID=UPI000469FEE6|nr:1,4-dihydroxy-2-naphthoate polyprenyltransferase [Phocaeicola paurosaccharolyticus]
MKEIKINSVKAWILASRPKTLSGAAVPVLIGSSLAYNDGYFAFTPAILCFIFAFLMQIDANFINDLFDFIKGSDGEDRLGPKRACTQGWISTEAMKRGIAFTTMTASLIGFFLLFFGGLEMIPVGILCIIFAFLYTAGPYPLAYHGWGDLLVIIFFGFIPVGCTYYVMSHTWTSSITIASLACGIVIDSLLMVNNYRDFEQDKQNGKKTLIVKMGASSGKALYLITGVIAAELCWYFAFNGLYWAAILPQIYLIPHILTWNEMVRIGKGKELNRVLGKTGRNIFIFGLLLSLGIALG